MRNPNSGNFDVIGLQLEGRSGCRAMIICSHCGLQVLDIDEAFVFRAVRLIPKYETVVLHDPCMVPFKEKHKRVLTSGITVREFLKTILSQPTELEELLRRIRREDDDDPGVFA